MIALPMSAGVLSRRIGVHLPRPPFEPPLGGDLVGNDRERVLGAVTVDPSAVTHEPSMS